MLLINILHRDFVIGAVNEIIICLLVHSDAKFAADIIFKIVIVTVQVIFSNICKNGDIRSERLDVIQLKTADLCYIQWFWVFRYLPGKGVTDISYQGTIQSRFLTDMIGQSSGGCFSVASGNGYNLTLTFEAVG